LEMQKPIDDNLQVSFRRLQERGFIRKDIAIAELIPIFKTMHLGLTGLWAVEGPPFTATGRLLKQEIKLFCEGLEAKRK
jgi:hypothetical protein